MSNKLNRLEFAQWILERNLGWIAAAEVKVAFIVAINTAMLGALAAAFSSSTATHTAWACFFTVISSVGSLLALSCCGLSVLPRLTGPDSILFFGKIASHATPDYVQKFHDSTDDELLEDCLNQIHRNAEIAMGKFSHVRTAMWWSFFSLLPWVLAIALLVRV